MFKVKMTMAAIAAMLAMPVAAQAAPEQEGANKDELACLAKGIYFEARGEPETGQMAVGRVILNRVAHKAYPDTICDVVYQNAQRRNRCQFSFACDGIPDKVTETAIYEKILERARTLIACLTGCERTDITSGSTHYHTTAVKPYWSKKLTFIGQVGTHIFYRTEPKPQAHAALEQDPG